MQALSYSKYLLMGCWNLKVSARLEATRPSGRVSTLADKDISSHYHSTTYMIPLLPVARAFVLSFLVIRSLRNDIR